MRNILAETVVAFVLLSSAAFAQISTEIIQQDKRKAYFQIKDILASGYTSSRSGTIPKEIDLADCDPGSSVYGITIGTLRPALFDVAAAMLGLRMALNTSGHKSKIWHSKLITLENGLIDAVISKSDGKVIHEPMKKFTKWINNEVNIRGSKGSKFTFDDQCGGGLNEFTLVTKIPNARIEIIPKMLYLLCKKQIIDADDEVKCDNWLPPVRSGEQVFLGGIYKYRIRTPSGISPTSEFDSDRYARPGREPKIILD